MKISKTTQLLSLLSICLILQFCSSPPAPVPTTCQLEVGAVETPRDTTPRVTGIGGIFFKDSSPEETSKWYGK
ncbi:MAG: hypothetical protein ACPGED_12740, partial [Flavobacteriales bacterium]